MGAIDGSHQFAQPHSGDWTMTGKVPVVRVQGECACVPFQIERMNAIPHIKTMAGSPGADRKSRSASRNLAHGFCVPDFHALREPTKEDRNVRYSYHRDRLGWTTPQA